MEQAEQYEPNKIEPKWQTAWEKDKIYHVDGSVPGKKDWFSLSMFPYPSGELHIGHWYAFTPADAHSRFMRMQGYNVLQPQGFDSFGLPAENAAIRNNVHPRDWTYDNIENMRKQFRLMGNSYDWRREVVTCDPDYYRWNQYFFLKLMDAGLAYRDKALANWCPSCNTTLANEQVKEGCCERCQTAVTKRYLEQWFIKITKYADELMEMDHIKWPNRIKVMQNNWIGRSTGVEVQFAVDGMPDLVLSTFTTRIDTVFGIEFVAVAPESSLAKRLTTPQQKDAVDAYIDKALMSNEIERTAVNRAKTGVLTGANAVNPFNGKRIPIFVADYVLATYGTGIVMGVPAHDQRDFEFATKYKLPISVVIAPHNWDGAQFYEAYTGDGLMVNSDEFNGKPNREAMELIADKLDLNGWGKRAVTYHLRDWLISRQRYWGTPIPVVYCQAECGTVKVPYEDLPVLLPEKAEFLPDGSSPLMRNEQFLNTTCPNCGGAAKRETDTMDTFMDSSWYHLRYMGYRRNEAPFNKDDLAPWMPVHQYMGGAEHAVMHLLYARFFCKALRDMGIVDQDEPYARLFNQGVLTTQHRKISKRSNPLSPQPLVEQYGADALRCYLMFLGPWDQGGTWTPSGINGIVRWLRRVWELATTDEVIFDQSAVDQELEAQLRNTCHRTTKRITEYMLNFKFNTSIAALMELCNELMALRSKGTEGIPSVGRRAWADAIERLLLHLAPMAPHVAEELWQKRHPGERSVHLMSTPAWDEEAVQVETCRVVIQVNGRVRGKLDLPIDSSQEDVLSAAQNNDTVMRWLEGQNVSKIVYVPDKLLNLVLVK